MVSMKEKLGRAVVGIAGLGGLGSNVAVALARTNVGKLIIADFDKVEESNLNRQQYFVDQLGRGKVEAMTENLRRINPNVEIEGHQIKLTADNVLKIFGDADVIAECFDKAEEKQMLVETVLSKMPDVIVVSASGLAGYGNSNAIQTRQVSKRFILVGDLLRRDVVITASGKSGIDSVKILTAARVGIAACHQANAIVEVLMDSI
jgi:sulfur carrier protein ThiS adenylyltransferase